MNVGQAVNIVHLGTVSYFYSGWQPVAGEYPQSLIVSLTLFNVFINYLEDGIEGTLTKFVNKNKLGSEVDMSEGRVILQTPGQLEKWASKNSIKFKKYKCEVWHLG